MMKLLRLKEVQALIGVPAKRLRIMVRAGSFPALRIRTRIFVEPDQLTEFLRLCRVNSAEDAARRKEEEEHGSKKAEKITQNAPQKAKETPAKNTARRARGRARQRA